MSNAITQLRQEVADTITEQGITTYAFIPHNLNESAAVVSPASPYVVQGQVLGEWKVSLRVRLFAPHGSDNEFISEALDEMIVNVCDALRPYGVVQVSQPGIDRDSYSKPFLVTDITITTNYEGGQ